MDRHPNPTTFSGSRGGSNKKGTNSGRADHPQDVVNKRHTITIPYRNHDQKSRTKQRGKE